MHKSAYLAGLPMCSFSGSVALQIRKRVCSIFTMGRKNKVTKNTLFLLLGRLDVILFCFKHKIKPISTFASY